MKDPEEPYAVVKALDQLFPEALHDQKSGYSVDMRVYFRQKPDGSQWGSIALLDRATGQRVRDAYFPLAHAGDLDWFFEEIARRGFEAVNHKDSVEPVTPDEPVE